MPSRIHASFQRFLTRNGEPSSFALSTSIFLRLLAVIHLIAFTSLWTQLSGLIGPHGILPAARYLDAFREHFGGSAYLQLPTLAWLFGTDAFLPFLCAIGVVSAALLFAGIAPALCLAVLWLAYLSLVNVGQIFLGFQWDALLLEVTLLSIFLAPWRWLPRWRLLEPPPLAHFLLRWLTFRLMLLSGIVKLTSGDPTWRNFTALTFHYETQPLPNPLAFWTHHLPASFHQLACAGMFFTELVVPFFLFAPRRLRHPAALLLAALQLIIALTGNYAFFNLLTAALCLLSLDGAFWHSVLPRRFARSPTPSDLPPLPRWSKIPALAGAAVVVLFTSLQALPSLNRSWRPPAWFNALNARIGPFYSLNNYGLFAVMTTSRPELIFEGSNDGRLWHAYELPYKPGDLSRAPPIVAPHQPRLDWQLWFAALGAPQHNLWVSAVCEHLLRGTPDVLRLFEKNPFPDQPPRYVRVVRYDYRFTTPEHRARTGQWWRRTPIDYYIAPAALK